MSRHSPRSPFYGVSGPHRQAWLNAVNNRVPIGATGFDLILVPVKVIWMGLGQSPLGDFPAPLIVLNERFYRAPPPGETTRRWLAMESPQLSKIDRELDAAGIGLSDCSDTIFP